MYKKTSTAKALYGFRANCHGHNLRVVPISLYSQMSATIATTTELDVVTREASIVPSSENAEQVSVHVKGAEHLLESSSPEPLQDALSRRRSAAIIVTIASINALKTCEAGILTVALPRMGKDLGLPRELLLWYEVSNTLYLSSFS